MEEFTSQDPIMEVSTEPVELFQIEDPPPEENLFLSDQSPDQSPNQSQITQDQSIQNNILIETREIKDLLKESLVESTSEETTDYISILYDEVKKTNENLSSIEQKIITVGKDQQTIGVLGVGSLILLIGALTVFFFLGRVR